MSKILNEELAYMKYLLGYKKGVVISEQETQQQATSTPQQTQATNNNSDDGCKKIVASGKFSATKADSTEHMDNIIAKLDSQIKADPLFANGGLVTNLRLIGGASNYNGGKVTNYTLNNDYTPVASQPTLTDNDKNNMKYALARANAAKQPVIDELEKLNLTIQGEPKIESHIINTNGKTDEKNTSGNPGQIVMIEAMICPLKQAQSSASREEIDRLVPLKPKLSNDINLSNVQAFKPLYECYKNLTLDINYIGSGHNCEKAVWDVYANDIPLSRESRWGKVSFASLNNVCDNYDNTGTGKNSGCKRGGHRFNKFSLNEITAKEFLNLESVKKYKGELQISMKCQIGPKGTLDIAGHTSSGGGCHKGITTIKVTTNEGEEEDETTNTPSASGEKKVVHTVSACKGVYNRIVDAAGGNFENLLLTSPQPQDNKKKLFRRNKA